MNLNFLQERLQEPSAVMKAGEGMTENERLFLELRQTEAAIKTLTEHKDKLKEEVKALVNDGEMVGNPELGHYGYQDRVTTTFDWKAASMAGLFTTEQAAPFMKKTEVKALVLIKAEKP